MSSGIYQFTNGVSFKVSPLLPGSPRLISWNQSTSLSTTSRAIALTEGIKLNTSLLKAFKKSPAIPEVSRSEVNPIISKSPPDAVSTPSLNKVPCELADLAPPTNIEPPKKVISIKLTVSTLVTVFVAAIGVKLTFVDRSVKRAILIVLLIRASPGTISFPPWSWYGFPIPLPLIMDTFLVVSGYPVVVNPLILASNIAL